MRIFMFYVVVGPYLWVAQVIGVIVLGLLSWRAPSDGWPAALQGRTASTLAVALAGIFTVLLVPVALITALRQDGRQLAPQWTDPFGLACIAQALLFVAAGVNAFLVHRTR